MELSTHLNSNEGLLPGIPEKASSSKRVISEVSEIPEEASTLKLRKNPASISPLTTTSLTGSSTNLPSLASLGGDSPTETEANASLKAYVKPSQVPISSSLLLHPSANFRSSAAETGKRVEADLSDTESCATEPGENQETSPKLSSPTSKTSIEESLPDWAVQEPEDITHLQNADDILAHKGITRSLQFFAKGNFGRVYDATICGDPKSYLYKHYLKPISFEEAEGKFWRQSDFAAARLHDIPHLVKPLFFIVLVKEANGSQKKVFVPAIKVQQFGKALSPGSKVFLQGQFMEKVPGKTLQAWRESGLATLSPDRQHFHNIAVGLHRFLTAARPHNYIHRDLNLNNIIYDKDTGKVSIVDLGQGVRLRSRGKTEETMKNQTAPNPATSKVFTGTPDFMASAVVQQKDYGAEVETGSVALLLLNLVDEEDFERFSSTRFDQTAHDENQFQDLHFQDKDPSTFLQTYLEKIGEDSETSRILQLYPEVREIIDLAFRASAPGPAGEAAFVEFQGHPYFAA